MNRVRIITGEKTRPTAIKIKEMLINNYNIDNVKLIKRNVEESTFNYNPEKDYLINWGCSKENKFTVNPDINNFRKVQLTSNKLLFFKVLERLGYEDYIPKYAMVNRNMEVHKRIGDGSIDSMYVLRESPTGFGGKGITIVDFNWNIIYSDRFRVGSNLFEELQNVGKHIDEVFSFYTHYFKAIHEYRVYMFKGDCSAVFPYVSVKRLRTDENRPENPNFYIRNHDNGFIFQRELLIEDEERINKVLPTLEKLTKDLKTNVIAYDVRINNNGDWKILEGNSAPGLEGGSLEFYSEWFAYEIRKKFS